MVAIEASLKDKQGLYLELINEVQDEFGFIDTHECDSLLWTSLAEYSEVSGIDLLAARSEETNQWYRTPAKDCYDNYLKGETGPGSSKSDISKDMFTGLFWAAGDNLRKVDLEEIEAYGKEHNWVMGRGLLSRTLMSVNLQNTLAILLGKKKSVLPELWESEESLSGTHLSISHILLRGELKGKITEDMLSVIKSGHIRWPDNGLFRLAYAMYVENVDLMPLYIQLMSEKFFPSGRLPDTQDRCSNYIWKNEGEDLDPCEPYIKHSGVDYLFIMKLLENQG